MSATFYPSDPNATNAISNSLFDSLTNLGNGALDAIGGIIGGVFSLIGSFLA